MTRNSQQISEMCDVSNCRWGKPACLAVGDGGQLASSSSHLGPHWLGERVISGYGGRFDFRMATDFADKRMGARDRVH
jgi:hypothetical protein